MTWATAELFKALWLVGFVDILSGFFADLGMSSCAGQFGVFQKKQKKKNVERRIILFFPSHPIIQ